MRKDQSYKDSEGRNPSFIANPSHSEADIGYFEQKLDEFKLYFSENYNQNRLNKAKISRTPEDDMSRVNTMIMIYEFILSKNKEMLHAINKERKKNDELK